MAGLGPAREAQDCHHPYLRSALIMANVEKREAQYATWVPCLQ